ncbi:hypothetical protein PFISCL1PPCAC_28969 [Pristionchus fissidentatus]|uniref:C3H1-type domain-containing protein n=1 Tax=Pristionchus fissidentatus TaxID=1538716 RepID=A0AAV5WZM1_9BILA|nr:hypothetical protein PFISCL1PPCAC_28969 [Pristionchus fissidentatus]
MKKSASESRFSVAAERSEDRGFVCRFSSPLIPRSPRAALVASPRGCVGRCRVGAAPRSALSFRKIGDQIVRPGSKICFEWAESKSCKAGVFCHYEHGEGAERTEKKVCSRMLRGLCRGEPSCLLPHGLLGHQMPICEHYLRIQCKHGPEECGLVHIKHNDKVQVCVFFNQGKCTKEDDCSFRHQYRSGRDPRDGSARAGARAAIEDDSSAEGTRAAHCSIADRLCSQLASRQVAGAAAAAAPPGGGGARHVDLCLD